MRGVKRSPADFVSPTVSGLPPSGIRKFFDLVAASKGVISLGVGEPDFVTPWHIREAAIYAIERGQTSYTSNWGSSECRRAVADYLAGWQGLAYNPDNEVLITVGVAQGIDLALRAVLAPGDEVLVPEPCFVSYGPLAILAGGTPVTVQCRPEDGFKLTVERLAPLVTPRTKALLLGFPNNPTGATMNREELLAIARFAEEHDLLVLSDEIYGELSYAHEHAAFAALPGMQDRTVYLSGVSKAFAMTGWRIGYACGPRPIIEAMMKINQYAAMCATSISQAAAVEALKAGHPEMEKMKTEYDRRRRLVVAGLRGIGLTVPEPGGAFYVFPRVDSTGLDGETFAAGLLEQEKVAVVPGSAFGSHTGGFVRASYAASVEKLEKALERIGHFVGSL